MSFELSKHIFLIYINADCKFLSSLCFFNYSNYQIENRLKNRFFSIELIKQNSHDRRVTLVFNVVHNQSSADRS